jgi:hypothetical protein
MTQKSKIALETGPLTPVRSNSITRVPQNWDQLGRALELLDALPVAVGEGVAGEAEAPKLTRVGECGTATGFTQDTSPKHRAALRPRFKNTQGTDPADRRLYHLGIDTTSVPVEACLDAIVAAAAG